MTSMIWSILSTSLVQLVGMPPSFESAGASYAFIDIDTARYELNANLEDQKIKVETRIDFELLEEAHPLLDLRLAVDEVFVNGERVTAQRVSDPERQTTYLGLGAKLPAGRHQMILHHELTQGVSFDGTAVHSAFWFSDLEDGSFLEQYLPSNLEFDQFRMVLTIQLEGRYREHQVFTNGKVVESQNGFWSIEFPETYNTAAPFFHFGPKDRFRMSEDIYVANSGKRIPVIAYTQSRNIGVNLGGTINRSKEVMSELEADYGEFPHDQMIVYLNPFFGGGMEHHGATVTNSWALAHEITHSYFGRGLMPAHGDAGWLDEAIASWRDNGYPRLSQPRYSRAHMAKRSAYIRSTPMSAYSEGASLMGHLDHLLAAQGSSLKNFLKGQVLENVFEPWTTESFQADFEDHLGSRAEALFNRYVYGKAPENTEPSIEPTREFPQIGRCKHGVILTEELRQFLL